MAVTGYFHDSFGTTATGFGGSFSGRTPDVGGTYSAPYGDDLTTIALDSGGNWDSAFNTGSSTAAAGSALAGTPTTLNYAIKSSQARRFIFPEPGSEVAAYIEAYVRTVSDDRKLVGFKYHRQDLGSGFRWYLEPFVGDSSGTSLYDPSPIDVENETNRFGPGYQDEDIRVFVEPSGVRWVLHGITVASTSSVPDVAPEEIVLRNTSVDTTVDAITWHDLQVYSINDAAPTAMTSTIYLDRMDGTSAFDARTPDVGAAYVQAAGYFGDPANMVPNGSGSLPNNTVDDPDPYSSFTSNPTDRYTMRFLFTPTVHDGTNFSYLDMTAYDVSDDSWLIEAYFKATEDNGTTTPMFQLSILVSDQEFVTIDFADLDLTPLVSVGSQYELKCVVEPEGTYVYFSGTLIWFTMAVPDIMPNGAMVGGHTNDSVHANFNLDEYEFLVPEAAGPTGSITDQQFADWIANDDNERVVAVQLDYRAEVSGAPVVKTDYSSDLGYVDPGTGQAYPDGLSAVPNFTRELSGQYFASYSSSLGSLDYDNSEGDYDFLLDAAFDGSEVRVYVGSPTWDFVDFRHVFTVFGVRATAPDTKKLSVEVKDLDVFLNKSIGGTVLVGGGGPNSDKARPLNFGAVRQVECILLDEGTLTYVHSDTGTNTAASAVRDNGASVGFSDNSDGTATLLQSPAGTITADVMALPPDATLGDTTARRVSDAMRTFVGGRAGLTALGYYGGAHASFVDGDSDDYELGFNVQDQTNVSDFLTPLTDSGNCFWSTSRLGLFKYGRIRPGDVASISMAPVVVGDDDVDKDSAMKLDHTVPQYSQFQGYMNKNWSTVSNLAFALPPDDVATLTRKGLYRKQADPSGTTYAADPAAYHLSLQVSPSIETWLANDFGSDDPSPMDTWMATRQEMSLPWIESVSVTVGFEFYALELGDVVNLSVSCWDLDSGALFQVTSVNLRPTDAKVDLTLVRRRPAQ